MPIGLCPKCGHLHIQTCRVHIQDVHDPFSNEDDCVLCGCEYGNDEKGIMSEPSNPIRVNCIYCNAQIVLNEDSEANRNEGTDPLQQLRSHLFQKHPPHDLVKHHRNCGWLIDMLAFKSLSGDSRWRVNIDRLVTYYLQGPTPMSPQDTAGFPIDVPRKAD